MSASALDRHHITIDTDSSVTLPTEQIVTGRGFITGKSGSGKSNSAGVIAEELLKRDIPFLVVDPDGEYYGLKEHYEILHAGADETAEIQVGPEHADALSEIALEDNVPIILDISGYLDDERARDMVRKVARRLFVRAKDLKKPFLLIVEEAHEYIPQTGGKDDLAKQFLQIAKRGRKHGLGICAVSQRPANVDKDMITQADWIVWHRFTWENDIDTASSVLGPAYRDEIPDLDDGESFLLTDWNDEIQRVRWRRKETYDAGETPGLDDAERPDLKSIGGDLTERLEAISEQEREREDRVDRLERLVEEKEETIAELERDLRLSREVSRHIEGGEIDIESIKAEIAEFGEGDDEEIAALRADKRRLEDDLDDAEAEIAQLRDRVAQLEEYEERVQELETIEERWDELVEVHQRLGELVGRDTSDSDVARLRDRVQRLQEENESLEADVARLRESGGGSLLEKEFTDALDYVQEPDVQAEIDHAAEGTTISRERFGEILVTVIDQGEASIDLVTELIDADRTTATKTLKALYDHDILDREQDGHSYTYRVNTDGLHAIVERQERRKRIQDLRGDLDI